VRDGAAAGAKPRKAVVNDDLLLDCFDRLKDTADADGRNFRYVAALLLMRRKRFRFEDAARDAGGARRAGRAGRARRDLHHVTDPRLNDEQMPPCRPKYSVSWAGSDGGRAEAALSRRLVTAIRVSG
jgi:hypothetical protein